MIASLQVVAAEPPFLVLTHPRPVGKIAANCIYPLVVALSEAPDGFQVSEINKNRENVFTTISYKDDSLYVK